VRVYNIKNVKQEEEYIKEAREKENEMELKKCTSINTKMLIIRCIIPVVFYAN